MSVIQPQIRQLEKSKTDKNIKVINKIVKNLTKRKNNKKTKKKEKKRK